MERIADHAVNIAEHVTFIVTGSFPEEPAAAKDEE
jgi:phosphate uptake regulator